MFDRHGRYVGSFYTGTHYAATNILMKQVVIYNDICKRIIVAKEIEKASLHNQRAETLNLDIAEIFKPIIVDRAIFTLLNRYELSVDKHFRTDGKAVLLSEEGKRVFIEKLEENLYRKLTVGKETVTYDKLIDMEIKKILLMIDKGEKYKAYKYS